MSTYLSETADLVGICVNATGQRDLISSLVRYEFERLCESKRVRVSIILNVLIVIFQQPKVNIFS